MVRTVAILFTIIFVMGTGHPALAFEDPTHGQPFLPWLWRDQFKPTLFAATDRPQLWIVGAGIGSTVAAHQWDAQVREEFGHGRGMPAEVSQIGSLLGSGAPGIAIAVGQLFFDQANGLRHGRALALTSLTAITTAVSVQRVRPNGHPLSFPSGHTSSAFATATSLAYAYGPWVGVPALAVAAFIGASRINDDAHWLSDTVAGASLGIFWARASAMADLKKNKISLIPVLVPGGFVASFNADF